LSWLGCIDARRREYLETSKRDLHPDVIWWGLRPDLICASQATVVGNVCSGDGWLAEVSGIEPRADGDQLTLGSGANPARSTSWR